MKPRLWYSEQFLDWLNNRVCATAKGGVRIRTSQEKDARDAGHPDTGFVFGHKPDIVVKGYCALEDQEESRRWLYYTIGGLRPVCVLMLATCCDAYDEEFQGVLRMRFPNILWLFPDMSGLVHDFGSDEGVLEAAQCLVAAGIIAHADNDS